MYSKQRKGASLHEVITYTLPKLHTGKNWYIDFLCYDPIDGKMRRKKYMLDSIKSQSARKKQAAEIITNCTNRLREGWNPWADASNSRQYTKLSDICDIYIKYLNKLTSSKAIKNKTNTDYKSRLNILVEYNNNLAKPIVYIYQLNQSFISDFLDYILLDRDSNARTRNNYRIWASSFCTWLIEKQYLEVNPVEKIKTLAEKEKFRSSLTKEDLIRMKEFLEETNKHFLLACRMEYYTFIRPDELSNIRLQDINIKEQKVFIASTISKNRRDGMVGLNDEIIKLMIDIGTFNQPSHYFLFGKNFKPSEQKADARIFREYFIKVRAFLRFPKNYQFYSLKDSGIRDLANAEGIVIARDQARHSDISTTNRYLKGNDLTVHEETKHFTGSI
ncbi:site-specific integrase [Bacteroides fragilis]|uniref:tyrosine-type recombinase/integrase n=1 Tax=Bacteroides fragilis TaxID=817 RepID=UPI00202FA254|nr:site-specific integrase [Bacteroides fragilis]MCM0342529.1 site-specific integrase [Bacteroides fragilis]